MFDTDKREVYLAFSGKIDAALAYGVLVREGYDIEETDESFNSLTHERATIFSGKTWAYAGISEKELAERLAIEERHAPSDVDCR